MSRRSYPKVNSGSERATGRWNYPGGSHFDYDFSSPYESSRIDCDGPNTPGWPSVKSVNNYSGFRTKVRYSPAHWTGTDSSSGGQGAGTWPMLLISGVNDPPSLIQGAADRTFDQAHYLCLSKLITRIKDQKVNVAVAAAEFKKTCGTITDAASRIGSAFRKLRSGNASGALGTLLSGRHGGGSGGGNRNPRLPNSSSVASDWLAMQYGWKPLLSDVYGATEELARTLTYKPPGSTVTAKATCEESVSTDLPAQASNQPSCKVTAKVSSSCQGVVEFRNTSPQASFLANTGILNPLSVAWELIPYSFVADWFLPVGSFLNNLDYDIGLEFVRGWFTTKTSASGRVVSNGGTHSSGSTTQSWTGGVISFEDNGIARVGMDGFPSVPAPRWKDPLSLGHAENAIALLRSAFGR